MCEDRELPSLRCTGESDLQLGNLCFLGVVGGDEEVEGRMDSLAPLVPLVSFAFVSPSAGTGGDGPCSDLRGLLIGGVCVEGMGSDLVSPGVVIGVA